MRRLGLICLLAGLPLAGCVESLLGLECEDECVKDERTCDRDQVMACELNLLLSSCTYWAHREDCRDRRANCVGAQCVCPPGLADCGVCVDPATDPGNCGGCGVRCAGLCVGGVCGP